MWEYFNRLKPISKQLKQKKLQQKWVVRIIYPICHIRGSVVKNTELFSPKAWASPFSCLLSKSHLNLGIDPIFTLSGNTDYEKESCFLFNLVI